MELSLLRGGVPASQPARGGLMYLITAPVLLCVSTNKGWKIATKLQGSSFICVQGNDCNEDGRDPEQPVADTSIHAKDDTRERTD